MTTALVYLGGCTLALLLLSFFYGLEDRRGRRVILGGFRDWLDRVLVTIGSFVRTTVHRFGTSLVKLLFHYGAHQLLKRVLGTVRNLESRLEHLLRQNKAVAKELNGERQRTHLDEIADHKQESALSNRERNKLLKQ